VFTVNDPDMVEVRPNNHLQRKVTMTASTIALAELAEKGADVGVLRQTVQVMAQRLMELDVEGRCGAGYDEKSAERRDAGQCGPRGPKKKGLAEAKPLSLLVPVKGVEPSTFALRRLKPIGFSCRF
jgi:uncharacterized low-complexity protein